MRVLVFGGSGLLGQEVCAELDRGGIAFWAPRSSEVEICDPVGMVLDVLENAKTHGDFDWCINCSAYTAVDRAESDVEAATALNVVAPTGLAAMCGRQKIKLVHISTDFVFDGEKRTPYVEMDPPNPLGVYGATKLEGERGVQANLRGAIIVRTSWLYGPGGGCFPKSIVNAWLGGKKLRVVSDQVGSPTCTIDLAKVLVWLAMNSAPGGTYHAGGPDIMSWHALAELSVETYREVHPESPALPEIEMIASNDWPTAAERPLFSALDSGKLRALGAPQMRPTRDSLLDTWRKAELRTDVR